MLHCGMTSAISPYNIKTNLMDWTQLKIFTKRQLNELTFMLGRGVSLLRPPNQGFIVVYHGIDRRGLTRFNKRFTSIRCFKRHLKFFKKNFNVLPLADFWQARHEKNDRLPMAITFDDGYQNNFIYALPLLEQMKTPATFYVTAIRETDESILWVDFLDIARQLCNGPIEINDQSFSKNSAGRFERQDDGALLVEIAKRSNFAFKKSMMQAFRKLVSFENNQQFFPYWQVMTDDEIKQTARSEYVGIGSHAHYHNNLGLIDGGSATEELRTSKQYLEGLTQKPVASIAYPDGSYTRELVDAADTIGYRQQLAVQYLFDEDKNDDRIMDRFGISTNTSCYNQLVDVIK